MPVVVESSRHEWEEGYRRFQARAREPGSAELYAQVEEITAELRRRIGQTFTLAELAGLYRGAEDWARERLSESAAGPGWARTVALAVDAAFYLYQRGAVDYRP